MNSADLAQVVAPVAAAFDLLQVPFYIGGSVASSAYGEFRATADVDLVADLRAQHVTAFVARLGEEYYADEFAISEAVAHHSSFNLIHQQSFLKVDVFIFKGRAYDGEAMKRRRLQSLGSDDTEMSFHMAAPEDILLAKLEWFRLGGEISDRQWRDIKGICKMQRERLDFDYLRHWAGEIGVADLLARAYEDAGLTEFSN